MLLFQKAAFLVFSLSLLLALSSCGNDSLYENHKELENGFWEANNLQSFDVNIDDTQNHSIYYHLRYT